MTAQFLNVTTPVEGSDGKTRFLKVGVAFPGRADQNYEMKIKLDATPINGELILFAPKPRSDEDDIVD